MGSQVAVLPPDNALNALNILSPLAPPVYGGLMTPDGAVDFTYPYEVTLNPGALAAGQTLSDKIATNTDADFRMTAQIINVYTSIQFGFRLNVNGVYYLSDAYILAGNLASDPSAPPPVMGRFIIPRGATLGIDLIELSGAANSIQLLFRGMKLYGRLRNGTARSGAAGVPVGLGRR